MSDDDIESVYERAAETQDPQAAIYAWTDVGPDDELLETVDMALELFGVDMDTSFFREAIAEQELVQDHLVPHLDDHLNGYEVVTIHDKAEEYTDSAAEAGMFYGEAMQGERDLPLLDEGWPSDIYVVEEGGDPEDGYAAAIDTLTRTVEVQDDALYDDPALEDFREKWQTAATYDEVPVDADGSLDVSEVTIAYDA